MEYMNIPHDVPTSCRYETLSSSGDAVCVSWVDPSHAGVLNTIAAAAQRARGLATVLEVSDTSSPSLTVVTSAPGSSIADTVTQRLAVDTAFDYDTLWAFLVQGLGALEALHSLDVVHGDVSASARIDTEGGTMTLGLPLLGRPAAAKYAPPEIVGGSVAGDVYELGCTLLEVVHLRDARQARLLQGGGSGNGGSGGAADVELAFLLEKMTEQDPVRRPTLQQIFAYAPVRSRVVPSQTPPKTETLQHQLDAQQTELEALRAQVADAERHEATVVMLKGQLQLQELELQKLRGEGVEVLRKQLYSQEVELEKLRTEASDVDRREEAVAKREAVCEDDAARLAVREAKVTAFLALYEMTSEQLHRIPTCVEQQQLFADYYQLGRDASTTGTANTTSTTTTTTAEEHAPHHTIPATQERERSCSRELSFSDVHSNGEEEGAHETSSSTHTTQTQAGSHHDASFTLIRPGTMPSPIRPDTPEPLPSTPEVLSAAPVLCEVVHEGELVSADYSEARSENTLLQPFDTPTTTTYEGRANESRVEEITIEEHDSSGTHESPSTPPSRPAEAPPSVTPPRTHEDFIAWHLSRSPEKYLTPRDDRSTPLQKCRLDPSGHVVKPWQQRSIQDSLQHSRAVLEDMAQRNRANSKDSRRRTRDYLLKRSREMLAHADESLAASTPRHTQQHSASATPTTHSPSPDFRRRRSMSPPPTEDEGEPSGTADTSEASKITVVGPSPTRLYSRRQLASAEVKGRAGRGGDGGSGEESPQALLRRLRVERMGLSQMGTVA